MTKKLTGSSGISLNKPLCSQTGAVVYEFSSLAPFLAHSQGSAMGEAFSVRGFNGIALPRQENF